MHALKKIRLRSTWNKYNLYNIWRVAPQQIAYRTFFQQKWEAKAETRAYHGEQVKEKKWTHSLFSRRIPAVVSMRAADLARSDGREMARGRGAGRDVLPTGVNAGGSSRSGTATATESEAVGNQNTPASSTTGQNIAVHKVPTAGGKDSKAQGGGHHVKHLPDGQDQIPYMQMTYWTLERRLDTAIWRAMFASSVRQARQFVVHGFVKVNGKKMRHPSYLLNPGDLFTVDVERVLFATGARKDQDCEGEDVIEAHNLKSPAQQAEFDEEYETAAAELNIDGVDSDDEFHREDENDESEPDETDEDEEEEEEGEEEEDDDGYYEDGPHSRRQPQRLSPEKKRERQEKSSKLKQIRSKVLEHLQTLNMNVKRKRELRNLLRRIKKGFSQLDRLDEGDISELEFVLEDIEKRIRAAGADRSAPEPEVEEEIDGARARRAPTQQHTPLDAAPSSHLDVLTALPTPTSPSKPYATPWRPRDYMSPFAFIPRYLEVNHHICSAVYLRHPVARPGLAEVPTPFGVETGQLAWCWYLRRR